MASILMPLPASDFDPSEVCIPWKVLTEAGHSLVFASPDAQLPVGDPRMLHGHGLGLFKAILAAESPVRSLYTELATSPGFQKPLSWAEAADQDFDAIVLPGGHAKGIRPYLESEILQKLIARQDAARKTLAAICHGVVLVARSQRADGKSVLYGKRTTSLLKTQEILAWTMTRLWLGDYYRTYPQTVEDEVKAVLESPADFDPGPLPVKRDSMSQSKIGHVVVDGHYISARWPGDAHGFAHAILEALQNYRRPIE